MNPILVEVCADSLESAEIAQKAGAQRIELCSALSCGGLTPSVALMEYTRKKVTINIHALIRPRNGDFLYSDNEIQIMCRDIEIAKSIGVNGIVCGVLTPDGTVDIKKMKTLLEAAYPLRLSFHRAFDMLENPYACAAVLKDIGIERILTSGQKPSAVQGTKLISDLINMFGNEIIIMPGAGITANNIKAVITATGATEVHLSGKTIKNSDMYFRNESIAMGSSYSLSEYEHYIADEYIIRNAIKNISI